MSIEFVEGWQAGFLYQEFRNEGDLEREATADEANEALGCLGWPPIIEEVCEGAFIIWIPKKLEETIRFSQAQFEIPLGEIDKTMRGVTITIEGID